MIELDECPQDADANSLPDQHLQLALLYAGLCGWRVFPCHSIRDGHCSCGKRDCDKAGKHPRTKRGFRDATSDESQIRKWWEEWPDANVAIATGNGLLAIDVDPRHGGDATLAELESRLGKLPRRAVVSTGGGGQHFFFSIPKNATVKSKSNWKPGIDTRADGGYVVAPPSNHISGGQYNWQEPLRLPAVIRPLPARWFRELPTKVPDLSEWHARPAEVSEKESGCREGVENDRRTAADQETPDSYSFLVSLSVNGEWSAETLQRLNAAIQLTTVAEPATRHHQLLRLGCLVSRIPELRTCYAEDLEPTVRRWFARSLPRMRTKEWQASWEEWLQIWPWVLLNRRRAPIQHAHQLAMDQPLPPIAEQISRKYSLRCLGVLVAMCRALQQQYSDENGVWFLSCRTAGEIFGVSHVLANKWLNLLLDEKVLEMVGEHVLGSRKAQRYRFIGDRLQTNSTDAESTSPQTCAEYHP